MPLGYVILSKAVPCPLSLLFHALFLSPVQAHNVASTIIWRDNQKIAGPWEGNTVKYPIPLEDCKGNIVGHDQAQEKSMKQEGRGQGTAFERMTWPKGIT